jgi:hypothetical protein
MPNDAIESLGTGPGGWGPKATGGGGAGPDAANGRRAAVYEDPDLQNPIGAFEDEVYTSPGRGPGGRRPSKADTEAESDRRMRM